MAIWHDLVEARDLTVFARRTQQDLSNRDGSLSRFFPAQTIDGDTAKYTITENGLVDAAEYRAWDTEAGMGRLHGGRRVALELPPISHKARIGELDHIRDRNDQTNQQRIAARMTAVCVQAIETRLEVARADVLESGRFDVEENGFHASVDLGRDSSMETSATVEFDDPGADILQDYHAWVQHYTDQNGVAPAIGLTSRKVLAAVQRSESVRQLIGGNVLKPLATLDEIQALFSSYGLPPLQVFDGHAQVGGVRRRLLSENKIFLLPTPGSNEIGSTIFGRTAESDAPEYGLVGSEAPGMVAALHREWDPFGVWVHTNAIGMPVMTNPNASMVAEVLA